jgi:peptidoglycan LD-endopeptidase CwlK
MLPAPVLNVFGGKSVAEMKGVHPEIIVSAHVALRLCKVDFCFFDGLRSREEQALNLATGASRSEESKHLTGDAADLVPWVDGALVWRKAECIEVARSMRDAIRFLGVSLIWGAVWDKPLELLCDDLQLEIDLYRERYEVKHRGRKKPLFDPAHFERTAA